jgi:hypothetical protein
LIFSPEILYNVTVEGNGFNLNTLSGTYNNTNFTSGIYTSPPSTQNLSSGNWLIMVSFILRDQGGGGDKDIAVLRCKCGSVTTTGQNAIVLGDVICGVTMFFNLIVETPAPLNVQFSRSGHELHRIAITAIRMGD